jgi:2-(1,2-epoxy-1,2-dihydrophenyl)acetyl-CoA isomerase
MEFSTIIYEKEGGIATITLNRPDKLNALDNVLLLDLINAFDDAREDDAVKALIITGAGRGFCSGADLASPVSGSNPKQPNINRPMKLEPFIGFGAMARRLHEFPKPVIAAVNGVSSGGGLSLALLADIRVASENASFIAVFVRRGLVADTGTTYLLPRIVGTANALRMMWTGEAVDAREAERLGIVSMVVPPDQLLSAARELAGKIAQGPSVAIELMKRMVYDGWEGNAFSLQAAYEGWAQEMCYLTDDFKEGVNAFLSKRKAQFTGN